MKTDSLEDYMKIDKIKTGGRSTEIMKMKKVIAGLMCGVLVTMSGTSFVSAKETDTCSGTCGNTGVIGSANITRNSATIVTTQTGSSGSVTVTGEGFYRDVSKGEDKEIFGSKSGVRQATRKFNVYEEDYMLSIKGKHTATLKNYAWNDETFVESREK